MKSIAKELYKRNEAVHERLKNFSYRERTAALIDFYWNVGAGQPQEILVGAVKLITNNAYIAWICSNMHRYKDEYQFLVNCMWDAQYENIAVNWSKTKQVYCFDSDFISEMAKAERSISIPNNIFDKLPFKTFYLDFKRNAEICSLTGADGVLVDILKMQVPEFPDDRLWLPQYIFFKDGVRYSDECKILNEAAAFGGKNSVIDLEMICDSDRDEYGNDRKLLDILTLQMILYLCSYEPDIRDDVASKMQRRKAKQQKKTNRNTELPEQLHIVGERFGAAFRKWTQGSLGQDSSSSVGGHVRPHVRRAHWHRYWVGKKGQQELTVKWVHECFCGLSEDEAEEKLDTVKHQVRKEG